MERVPISCGYSIFCCQALSCMEKFPHCLLLKCAHLQTSAICKNGRAGLDWHLVSAMQFGIDGPTTGLWHAFGIVLNCLWPASSLQQQGLRVSPWKVSSSGICFQPIQSLCIIDIMSRFLGLHRQLPSPLAELTEHAQARYLSRSSCMAWRAGCWRNMRMTPGTSSERIWCEAP